MSSSLLSIISVLGLNCLALQICRADLGETRAQIIVRYGKPNFEEGLSLRFFAPGAPGRVTLSAEGKSVQEVYGWNDDIGQKHIMEILLRSSKGREWRATKLDYPDTQMVWRYTQPALNLHAAYERNDEAHDAIYYGLTVGL